MSARKNVSASVVRTFAASPEGIAALNEAGVAAPGLRGRFDSAVLAVFHKANPRLRYEVASDAEKASVTVPVTKRDKRGRRYTRNVTLTTAEARAALGQPTSQRGRISRKDLAAALSEA